LTASNSIDQEIRTNLRLNLVVNLLDGGFFGFALGFASFVTVIPLFVSSMTNSAILIGLIPAIHSVGWQLPQLFTAHRVSNQVRFKPMVMIMTIHERLPFLGLAIVAWFSPVLGTQTALFLTFLLLIWQGLGGGFTATAWQSMIGKIIPHEYRGTFFGSQSAAANLLASLSAIIAGIILQRLASPQDFTLAFFCGFLAMVVSYIFLAQAREPARPIDNQDKPAVFWKGLGVILQKDANFRWFLIARMLSQLAVTGFAFYTVYAVNSLGMSDFSVGVLTSVLLATQIIANPIMGLFGDRWSHRGMMIFGISASILSALIAWKAPTASWFFPVMVLAGISNVAIWTISLAMIQEFGTANQRPAYIGLANTLIAPFTILAPFIGGIVANQYGYPAAFLISAVFGIITTMILIGQVRDPKTLQTVKLELQTGE
jgi:MFS family permease